ncbi:transposase [Deinococcus seoulensis]|uniref:Transposase n=1 Tax=Deinococcus seoulensis TaxID=1837379 RepID=A0ABQ2RWQ8_9DEIO|nr:RNA-guided endonuclease TnpB family protein [Deinococcus seoulensis]GGR67253.1 transposase [Deinococcus seoulensis]
MEITLTAKLKLKHTQEQKVALDAFTLSYRDALNHTAKVAFDMGKSSNASKIQKEVYTHLREHFGLKAQSACSVPRRVGASFKQFWTKLKDHQKKQAFRMEAGLKPRRFKGFDAPPKFVSRSLTMFYKKDYSFKKNQQVSVDTLNNRIVIPYEGYAKHLQLIVDGAKIGSGTLWYDRRKKQYYLLVALTVTLPDPQSEDHKRVVGVDVGQRYHAVVSDTQDNSFFQSGKQARQRKEHFSRLRKNLQRKGTRSATRKLIELSGRERRFIADWNHKLSLRILRRFPNAFIGLEDLTNIRDRTEGRRTHRANKKSRANKRRRSQWSFAELQTFLAYKAPLNGCMTVKVDAHFTSQACTQCGHTSKGNRPGAGLMFRCESCGYEVHSDLLGSRNITMRTLVIRQDWMVTGYLSTTPDVSDAEAKTARLTRYAGLRWSPETNPRL